MMSPLPLILSNVVLLFLLTRPKLLIRVDYSILVGRLRSIGVSEGYLAWFANYLSQRVQWIKSAHLLSQHLPVTKGLPQGSILGPMLFSIYFNNIAQAVGSSLIHLYSDDTVLFSAGPSSPPRSTTKLS